MRARSEQSFQLPRLSAIQIRALLTALDFSARARALAGAAAAFLAAAGAGAACKSRWKWGRGRKVSFFLSIQNEFFPPAFRSRIFFLPVAAPLCSSTHRLLHLREHARFSRGSGGLLRGGGRRGGLEIEVEEGEGEIEKCEIFFVSFGHRKKIFPTPDASPPPQIK